MLDRDAPGLARELGLTWTDLADAGAPSRAVVAFLALDGASRFLLRAFPDAPELGVDLLADRRDPAGSGPSSGPRPDCRRRRPPHPRGGRVVQARSARRGVMAEVDDVLARLAPRIDRLSRRAAAALFAACGGGLAPLFRAFSARTGWGEPEVLDAARGAASSFACGGEVDDPEGLLAALEANVPHADDSPAPWSLYAQDAVICVDAAVRCATDQEVQGVWIEYALEPVFSVRPATTDTAVAFCERSIDVLEGLEVVERRQWEALISAAGVLRPEPPGP